MATSFSGGGSRSTRKKTPTMGKQLVSVITCGCEVQTFVGINVLANLTIWVLSHAPIPLQGTSLLDLCAYKIVCKNIPIQG
jgi:hypothetical protein